jgi:hypothetical protein
MPSPIRFTRSKHVVAVAAVCVGGLAAGVGPAHGAIVLFTSNGAGSDEISVMRQNRAADLRHTNVGAYTPGAIPAVSYPSGGAYTPGAIPAVSYPQPVAPARAVETSDSSDGVSPTTIWLGIAGGLLAIGAIAGVTRRTRRSGRTRIAA